MNRRTIVIPLAAAAVAAAVPHGAYAADSPYSATGSYQCLLTSDATQTVTVTLALDSVPTEVKAGQKVPLSGKLTVSFPPQETAVSTVMLARSVTISKANFAMASSPGSPVKVTKVKGKATNPGTTFTLEAALKMATFTVPKSVGSDVTFSLPTKNTVANPLADAPTGTGTPKKVAFVLDLTQQGLTTSRKMACWLGDNKPSSPVAQIPAAAPQSGVIGGGAAPAGSSGGGAGALGSGSAGGGAPAPAPPAAPAAAPGAAPAAGAEPAAQPPSDVGPVDGAMPQTSAAAVDTASAAVPDPTKGQGTFVPSWMVLLIGTLIPLAALAYAIHMGQRLRAATARIDRPGGGAEQFGGAR